MRSEILVETIIRTTIEGEMIGTGMAGIEMVEVREMRMRRGSRVDRREEGTREIIRDLVSDRRLVWTVDEVDTEIEVATEIAVVEVDEGGEDTTVDEIIIEVMIEGTMATVGMEEDEVDEVAIDGTIDEVEGTDVTT